jgi:cobalt-zinc-cadmium efflux system membrane fusion protein
VELQSNYLEAWNQVKYLEQEYQRQKRLYEENVGSGKELQRVESEYRAKQGKVRSLEAQLKMLSIDVGRIREGHLHDRVPVTSPIDGYVQKVMVKTGQYVQPETVMFEVVNLHHIHADLMVFEKDVHKVKEGQQVRFRIESMPGKEMMAKIYAVGKSFEKDPKALHIHAEILNKEGFLIPGLYVQGDILVDSNRSWALPTEAIVQEGDRSYIFKGAHQRHDNKLQWVFTPVEVTLGVKDGNWQQIRPLEQISPQEKVAWNGAYYLIAEWKKGEGGHGHAH